jgi:hypothetical protein
MLGVVQLCKADVHPADSAMLHYRLIGFTFPENANATEYKLEVFEFNTSIDKSLQTKPVVTDKGLTNRFVATVPDFGKSYIWRVQYLSYGKPAGYSDMHFFTVRPNPYSNKKVSRWRILNKASKYDTLMVFFDNTRSLYNMQGEPLWFLPDELGFADTAVNSVRDLKITNDGTITMITNKNVYEIDYEGNVLWHGSNNGKVSGDSVEHYHHQFTKLKNGNYMTITNIMIPTTIRDTVNGNKSLNVCGAIVEYGKYMQLLWAWNSCLFINANDMSTHFNSFYLDEDRRVLYTGYRNLGCVLKTEYPSQRTLAQYGNDNTKNSGKFFSQHNVSINSDGNLMMFNNNYNMQLPESERAKNSVPTVAIFREPQTADDTLTKIWEFKCDIDTLVNPTSPSGGSVTELGKGDYLVCAGMPGRAFIVSTDKKLLWHVLSEKYVNGAWKPAPIYKISPVKKHDIEKLLFR